MARLPRALVLATLVCGACPGSKKDETARSDGGASSAPTAASRLGVKVPLPDGWTARIGADQSFRAGPGDRVVLRIDQEAGEGSELPSASALQQRFRSQMNDAQVSADEVVESDDSVVIRLRIVAAGSDAGQRELPVLLGAKRLGNDLFLCSTEPGASEEEVRKAAQACASLTRTAASK